MSFPQRGWGRGNNRITKIHIPYQNQSYHDPFDRLVHLFLLLPHLACHPHSRDIHEQNGHCHHSYNNRRHRRLQNEEQWWVWKDENYADHVMNRSLNQRANMLGALDAAP